MAGAGFHYTGTGDDDDSATCFVCGKILDGWENTDQPWQEHEKHAPNCSFVKLGLEQADMTVSSRESSCGMRQ
jgi:baculoviral IAP repeat-containing protein 5